VPPEKLTATAEQAAAWAEATQTAAWQQTATQRIEQTRLAGTATQQAYETYWREFLTNTMKGMSNPIYGPEFGSMPHDPDDGFIETAETDISLQDFVLEVVFYVPYPTSLGQWDFGILFRQTAVNTQYRLTIFSDSSFELGYRDGDNYTELDSGDIPSLDTIEGRANRVVLIARGGQGYLYVNGMFIAELDLSAHVAKGEVRIGTGMFVDREIAGRETRYEDLMIWEFP
jgi:hypothetical protein